MPRHDILAWGLNTHRRRLHVRCEQRWHANLPYQGGDRGRTSAMGHGPRVGEGQGHPGDGIWSVSTKYHPFSIWHSPEREEQGQRQNQSSIFIDYVSTVARQNISTFIRENCIRHILEFRYYCNEILLS